MDDPRGAAGQRGSDAALAARRAELLRVLYAPAAGAADSGTVAAAQELAAIDEQIAARAASDLSTPRGHGRERGRPRRGGSGSDGSSGGGGGRGRGNGNGGSDEGDAIHRGGFGDRHDTDRGTAGSADQPDQTEALDASAGSSARWLAAVAEAKLATWAERAERSKSEAERRAALDVAGPALGQFAVTTGADEAPHGRGGERDDGEYDSEVTGTAGRTGGRGLNLLRGGGPHARFSPVAAALGIGAVVVAAGIGFAVGGTVAAERSAATARAAASALASDPAKYPFDRRSVATHAALAEFERDQLTADSPPDTVSDDHFQLDTFRLLLTGSIADWTGRVYAAKDIEGKICVVLVQPDSTYAASCADKEQFTAGGVQVTSDVNITIFADGDATVSTITGVTATWPANGRTGLRFSSANRPR